MRKTLLVYILLVISASGCTQSSSEKQYQSAELKQPKNSTVTVPAESPTYTWATAKAGPGYIPRLVAMMGWYATQTENIRQMNFIESQSGPTLESTDGPPAEPVGPYEVIFETVDSYLGALRKSEYFSAHYLAMLHTRAQAQNKVLAHSKALKSRPNMEDFPLFPRNYDDMMDDRNSFKLSAEQAGRVVILNDGYTLRKFTFNAQGKIDSVASTIIAK